MRTVCHGWHYRWGVTVISRRAWIRFSRGGWVLKRENKPPLPNSGFTMHNAEVDGETEVVGMRWLYAPSFCKALIKP